MGTGLSAPTDPLAGVREMLTGRSGCPSPTLLADPYASTVRLKRGFSHLQVPAMPDPDERTVYLPLYEQVSTAVTLEVLRRRYCRICPGDGGLQPVPLELIEVSLALLHLAIRDDLQTARYHRCPVLAGHLEAWLLKTTTMLESVRTLHRGTTIPPADGDVAAGIVLQPVIAGQMVPDQSLAA
ncbi:MAG: hypothetical protein JWO93_2574 [Micrococcaceae bacterium]|jgi:hypothetical protein|nr:hypothetical protein [Micrococcaceae bacterium]